MNRKGKKKSCLVNTSFKNVYLFCIQLFCYVEHCRTDSILRKICSNEFATVLIHFPADASTAKYIREQDPSSFYFINDSCLDNSSLESSKDMLLTKANLFNPSTDSALNQHLDANVSNFVDEDEPMEFEMDQMK